MALVTVTYNVWDANGVVIPSSLMPEVWFRPVAASTARGLLTDREVKGTLNPSTGAGSVQLESTPGLFYVPSVRWLIDKDQASESERNRARGRTEWEPFYPGAGGDISSLSPIAGLVGLLYGYGPPPSYLIFAVYFDITGPDIKIYGPKGVI